MIIELEKEEVQQLLGILANAQFTNGINWAAVNPLIMKIGGQARLVETAAARPEGNAKEARQ